MESTEIACTLTDEEFRDRRKLARKTILSQVISYQRLNNGLEVKFANTQKSLADVKEFIKLEQGCCGFLSFELLAKADQSNELISLKISGPEGATKFTDIFVQLVEAETNVQEAI